MTRSLVLTFAALLLMGCATSQPASAPPVQPMRFRPDLALWWGQRLTIQADGTATATPIVRAGETLGDTFDVDVTHFVSYNGCFRFKGCEKIDATTLRTHWSFTHPIADTTVRTDLHIFDLRCHVLSGNVVTDYSGPAGISAPVGPGGSSVGIETGDIQWVDPDGWSTWAAEVFNPFVAPNNTYASNCYSYKLIRVDPGRDPLDPLNPAGWNVVPMSPTPLDFTFDLQYPGGPGSPVATVVLDASYGQSAYGRNTVDASAPGGRLNPLYFNPEFNLKEPWRVLASLSGPIELGNASSTAKLTVDIYDHQGALPASGDFDPYTSPPTSLRYASTPTDAVVSIPGALDAPISIDPSSWTGTGLPDDPYVATLDLAGDQLTGSYGDFLGLVAVHDSIAQAIGQTPAPTPGLSASLTPVVRRDFTTYQVFPLQVTNPACPLPTISAVRPSGEVGKPGDTVVFFVTADGHGNPITNYAWSWGGGANCTGASCNTGQPSVTLSALGTFDGTVTATSICGTSAVFPFTYTVVNCDLPVITSIQWAEQGGRRVKVTAASTNADPNGYVWDFGGGASCDSPCNTKTVFITLDGPPGTYKLSVTASNSCGISQPAGFNYSE